MKKIVSAVVAAALSLCVGAPAYARKQPIPEAKPIGKAVDCISISQIRQSRVRSDSIIDFQVSGKKWYRNTLPSSCPSLGFEERFSFKTSMSQLCSLDTIAVLQTFGNGVQEGARCGLGKFQPVELSKPLRK